MDTLDALLQRPIIVSLAIAGAVLSTVASNLLSKSKAVSPGVARAVLRFGYALAGLSVLLFIVAGFRA